MSLVAYTHTDSESESSGSEDRENGKVIIPEKGMFSSLPQPNVITIDSSDEEEEEDEFLEKKETPTEKPEKEKVKITIPSLSAFADDDDEPPHKRSKIAAKLTGLFALLPAPKTQPITTKHFVPNSVKRNMAPKPEDPKPKAEEEQEEDSASAPQEDPDSDDETDDPKDIPETFDEETWQKVCGKPKRTPRPIIEEAMVSSTTGELPVLDIAPEPTKPYDGLDNQAFKELLGANSKRKGENVKVIDISEDDILPDKDIWMTKSLTDPEQAAKYVVKDPVNDTCRRKHHITYLAQQAKVNEQELQNQWASNRYTRQKTQAKYGF